MSWPLSQDYNEAIQSPGTSFSDAELKTGEAANAMGIPMPRSGNFADVYEVRCPSGSRWAVKCFTREVFGLRERYAEISKYLHLAKLPFMVDFQYLEQGIRVRGQWYPILKMQWVEGFLLNEFVRDNLDKKPILQALGQIWLRMAKRLRESYVAHCDLQHGNVLFVPGSSANSLAVKLIDYDGMCVPSLAGTKSGEVGHPAYQHPERLRSGAYNQEVDRFSLLSIATALRCLSVGGKALWERYDTGDNLLFRQADLQAPAESPLFQELLTINDAPARELVSELFRACQGSLEAVPLLTDLVPELQAPSAAKPAASKRAIAVQASEAESAPEIAATDSAWDFESEDKPRSRRRRKGGLPRWVWSVAAAWVAGLVLAGGIVALGLWNETDKPKDTAQTARINSEKPSRRHGKSREKVPSKGEQSEGNQQQKGERISFLSEQEYLESKRHFNDPNTDGGFSTDGTIGGRKFTVESKESPHGIFLHPAARDFSEISYKLSRGWSTFLCGVAVPRMGEMGEERGLCLGESALFFEVVGDDNVLWTSKPVRDFGQLQSCGLNVKNVDVLRLRVYCPGNNNSARAVWIEPRVTTSKELLSESVEALIPAGGAGKVEEKATVQFFVQQTGFNGAGFVELYSEPAWNRDGNMFLRFPVSTRKNFQELGISDVGRYFHRKLIRATGTVTILRFDAGSFPCIVIDDPGQIKELPAKGD